MHLHNDYSMGFSVTVIIRHTLLLMHIGNGSVDAFLHCALSLVAQCIVIGPVCGLVCVCVFVCVGLLS